MALNMRPVGPTLLGSSEGVTELSCRGELLNKNATGHAYHPKQPASSRLYEVVDLHGQLLDQGLSGERQEGIQNNLMDQQCHNHTVWSRLHERSEP
jgi:hypothetical protein